MFKKGDRVLCVRGAEEYLIKGRIYTVLRRHEIENYKVIIEENSKYNWFSDRFILATPLIEALI